MIQWRSLGVPVRDAPLLDVTLSTAGPENRAAAYLSFMQVEAPCFVLRIDLETGELTRLPGPYPGGIVELHEAGGTLCGRLDGPYSAEVYLDVEAGSFQEHREEIAGMVGASQQGAHAGVERLDGPAGAGGWRLKEIRFQDAEASAGIGGRAGPSFVGNHLLVVEHEETGKLRQLPFGYRSGGAPLLRLVAGPGDRIHGFAGRPLNLFAYGRQRQRFERVARMDRRWQEVGAAAAVGDLLCVGVGPGAAVLVHDTTVGAGAGGGGATLWERAVIQDGQRLVSALAAGPGGKTLYAGTTPEASDSPALLMRMAVHGGKPEVLKRTTPGQAVTALAALPEEAGVVGGTSPLSRAAGGPDRTPYLFTCTRAGLDWQTCPLPESAGGVRAVVVDEDQVHGLTEQGQYFTWQPGTQIVDLNTVASEEPYPQGLSRGDDARLYAAFGQKVVAIESGGVIEDLGHCYGGSAGWALMNDEVYMGAGVHLMEGVLPPPDERPWGGNRR